MRSLARSYRNCSKRRGSGRACSNAIMMRAARRAGGRVLRSRGFPPEERTSCHVGRCTPKTGEVFLGGAIRVTAEVVRETDPDRVALPITPGGA